MREEMEGAEDEVKRLSTKSAGCRHHHPELPSTSKLRLAPAELDRLTVVGHRQKKRASVHSPAMSYPIPAPSVSSDTATLPRPQPIAIAPAIRHDPTPPLSTSGQASPNDAAARGPVMPFTCVTCARRKVSLLPSPPSDMLSCPGAPATQRLIHP
nr:hypothetical protein CFP56_36434 [Quercus suber]